MKRYDFSILDYSALAPQPSSSSLLQKENTPGGRVDTGGWLILGVAGGLGALFILLASNDMLSFEIIQQTPALLVIFLWILTLVVIFRSLRADGVDDPVRRFAIENSLFLATNKELPEEFEGLLLEKGRHKHMLFLADRRIAPLFFIADYTFVHKNKADTFEEYKVLSLKLPEITAPFIVDSKANNVLMQSNLPSGKEVSEVLDLEGDFGKYFRLYCVKGQQQAVLKILTPEVMALLIDSFSDYDLEVWKDRLYAYKKGEFRYEGDELPEALDLLAQLQKEFVR